jgi:hypothetical protein
MMRLARSAGSIIHLIQGRKGGNRYPGIRRHLWRKTIPLLSFSFFPRALHKWGSMAARALVPGLVACAFEKELGV